MGPTAANRFSIQGQPGRRRPFVDKGRAEHPGRQGVQPGTDRERDVLGTTPRRASARIPRSDHRHAPRAELRTRSRLINDGVDCGPGQLHSARAFEQRLLRPFHSAPLHRHARTAPAPGLPGAAGRSTASARSQQPRVSSTVLDNAYGHRGDTCTQYNWPSVPTGDPRLVAVFLTDEVPEPSIRAITTASPVSAGFYVTGLVRRPVTLPKDTTHSTTQATGPIWGHYVKLVLASADGTPSTAPCIQSRQFTACIAVLVR